MIQGKNKLVDGSTAAFKFLKDLEKIAVNLGKDTDMKQDQGSKAPSAVHYISTYAISFISWL